MADYTNILETIATLKVKLAELENQVAEVSSQKKKVKDPNAPKKPVSNYAKSLGPVNELIKEVLAGKKMEKGLGMKVASYLNNNKTEPTLESVKDAIRAIHSESVPEPVSEHSEPIPDLPPSPPPSPTLNASKTDLKIFFYEDGKKVHLGEASSSDIMEIERCIRNSLDHGFYNIEFKNKMDEEYEWDIDIMPDSGEEEYFAVYDIPVDLMPFLNGKKYEIGIFSSRHKYEIQFK